MIRYSLVCKEAHAFDAWFRDSEAFDEQSRQGHVECPHCGSGCVQKALMAPSIRRSQRPPSELPRAVVPVPVPVGSEGSGEEERFRQVRSMLREFHDRLKKSSEDVGRRFPAEARKIHEGEVPPRSIYGNATVEEVKSLLDDGIGVLPVPELPEDLN